MSSNLYLGGQVCKVKNIFIRQEEKRERKREVDGRTVAYFKSGEGSVQQSGFKKLALEKVSNVTLPLPLQ